jgi:hypothetical protein
MQILVKHRTFMLSNTDTPVTVSNKKFKLNKKFRYREIKKENLPEGDKTNCMDFRLHDPEKLCRIKTTKCIPMGTRICVHFMIERPAWIPSGRTDVVQRASISENSGQGGEATVTGQ